MAAGGKMVGASLESRLLRRESLRSKQRGRADLRPRAGGDELDFSGKTGAFAVVCPHWRAVPFSRTSEPAAGEFQAGVILALGVHQTRRNVFYDFLRQALQFGQDVEVGRALFLKPEDVKARLVVGKQLLAGIFAPASFQFRVAPAPISTRDSGLGWMTSGVTAPHAAKSISQSGWSKKKTLPEFRKSATLSPLSGRNSNRLRRCECGPA